MIENLVKQSGLPELQAQEARTAELIAKRKALLQEAGMGSDCFDLGKMPEEEFSTLLDAAKAAKADREAKAREAEKLHAGRKVLLEAEGVDCTYLPLGSMPQDEFHNRLETAKREKVARIEAAKAAESARLEAIRLRGEQEAQRREAEKREAALRAGDRPH